MISPKPVAKIGELSPRYTVIGLASRLREEKAKWSEERWWLAHELTIQVPRVELFDLVLFLTKPASAWTEAKAIPASSASLSPFPQGLTLPLSLFAFSARFRKSQSSCL